MADPELLIELDPHDEYYQPGETISGQVVIILSEPLTVRGVRVTFSGRIHVEFSDGICIGDRETLINEQIIFCYKKTLLGDPEAEEGPTLPAGRISSRFSFRVPPAVPGSFQYQEHHGNFVIGRIEYWINAQIHRPLFHCDLSARRNFNLAAPYDLNSDPSAAQSQTIAGDKSVGCCWFSPCCSSGQIGWTFHLPKRGYVPGEAIAVSTEIVNRSTKPVEMVRMRLVQKFCFRIRRNGFCAEEAVQAERKHQILTESLRIEPIPAGETQHWIDDRLRVPLMVENKPLSPTMPEEKWKSIEIDYVVQFRICLNGNWIPDRDIETPVIIGTVPLRDGMLSADNVHAV